VVSISSNCIAATVFIHFGHTDTPVPLTQALHGH
jgi:hypothetical protein